MDAQETNQTQPKPACKNCGSPAVVRFGSYKGVQRYYCKSCKRKFKADDSLFHMKVSAAHISSALSMYYSGMSINDIRNHLQQEHGYYPSKHVIYYWIDKYTDRAIKHFRDYRPDVGDTWVADETVLEIDGKNVWLWDIIDAKTRFLLASRVSYTRGTEDARLLMERAKKRAGKSPKTIITDHLKSYLDGIELTFGSDTYHKQSKPFTSVAEDSTNKIERWHGTLKDRTKVMRGLKDMESAIQFTEGYLIFYNFFRPHEALRGKTPADVAKVDYDCRNWAELSRLPEREASGASLVTREVMPKELITREPNINRILGQPSEKQIMRMLDRASGIPTPRLRRNRRMQR